MNKTLLLFSLTITLASVTSCQSTRPTDLGLHEGRLKKCPDSPNCVQSYDKSDKDHYFDPIKISSNKERAHQKITGILEKSPRAKIVKTTPDYIYAEFTSSLFKFVDDVEFDFTREGLVHFRSASRVGHSDLGANNSRIEKIQFKFYQNDF